MARPPKGYMRKPATIGQVAPHLVRDVAEAVAALHGSAARDALLEAAGIDALPGAGQSIDEALARKLHHTLRATMPEACNEVLYRAGQSTADALIASQLSSRARTMLKSGPWTVAADRTPRQTIQ